MDSGISRPIAAKTSRSFSREIDRLKAENERYEHSFCIRHSKEEHPRLLCADCTVERLREGLRKVTFVPSDDDERRCIACNAAEYTDREGRTHEPDCWLGQLLEGAK